jgi:MFS family permease
MPMTVRPDYKSRDMPADFKPRLRRPHVRTALREPQRPQVVRDHRLAGWFAVATVCFGAFMGQLDASVVTVAFPAMQRQFHAGLPMVQWVSLGYLLVLVALLVPAGRLSDRYGRKLAYLYGFLLFGAASAACGLASSLAVLIGLRLVQAAGAALLQSNSVALVATSVPARSRRKALGLQAAAQAVGLASGPVIGGLLVASVGWRWIFFVNVPVAAIALLAGVYLLPRTRYLAGQTGADLAGTVLLITAAATGMLAVSAASGLRLPAWALGGCAFGALLATAGLVLRERRTRYPLIDLAALSRAHVGAALGGALCVYLVLFGPLVLVPQVLAARGSGPELAGLLLTSLPVGFGVAAVGSERLPARWSNRTRCVIGGMVATACAAALAIPAPDAVTVVLLGLLGAGLGLYTPANNSEIMSAFPHQSAAAAGGMVNMARGIGTALGVALVTLSLHVGAFLGHGDVGPQLAAVALAGVALLATLAGRRIRSREDRTPRGAP